MTSKITKYPFLLVFFLSLVVFCLSLGNREPIGFDFRHAVLLRNWLEEGFSWLPNLFGEPYAQKPPLFFWVLYPIGKLTNCFNVWVLAMPAALSGVGTVLLMYSFLRKFNIQWAVISCLVFMTSYPVYLMGRRSSVDMLFVFLLTLTLIQFYSFYVWRRKGAGVWFLIGLILSFLIKGPFGILLPSAIIFFYLLSNKSWKPLLKCSFILGLLLIVCFLGWYGLCYLFEGREFVQYSLRSQTYSRVIDEPNKPFYYYLFVLLIMGLPWSFPLIGLLSEKLKKENKEHFSAEVLQCEKFVFIWFSVVFVVFTLIGTKHLRYILPVFAPMAVLTGSFFVGENKHPIKRFFWHWMPRIVSFFVVLIILTSSVWYLFPVTKELPLPLFRYLILGVGITVFGLIEFIRLRQKKPFKWISLISGLLVFQIFNAQFIEPTITYFKSPKEVVFEFEQVNQRQNPLAFYQFGRDDLFRYIYYSWRNVKPMLLFEPEKFIPTMKFMKYKRGYFVTYKRKYDTLPESIRKDCVIMQEKKFRNDIWVNAKWRDPEYP